VSASKAVCAYLQLEGNKILECMHYFQANCINLKILIHIFTVIYLTIIIIIMRGENFVAHLDGLGGTPMCRGTPVAHH
jgi:uncharacterized membrane protein YhdT